MVQWAAHHLCPVSDLRQITRLPRWPTLSIAIVATVTHRSVVRIRHHSSAVCSREACQSSRRLEEASARALTRMASKDLTRILKPLDHQFHALPHRAHPLSLPQLLLLSLDSTVCDRRFKRQIQPLRFRVLYPDSRNLLHQSRSPVVLAWASHHHHHRWLGKSVAIYHRQQPHHLPCHLRI